MKLNKNPESHAPNLAYKQPTNLTLLSLLALPYCKCCYLDLLAH